MITEVQAISNQGSLLTMPLEDVSGGIVIEDIQGLDPVKATIVSSEFATTGGAQYLSSRREPRYLKFTLSMEPDPFFETVRDVRDRLYEFFMTDTNVDLTFITNTGLTVGISGMIETFEAPLFTKEPKADISITCFRPEFIDPDVVLISHPTVETTTNIEIDYPGTVESAFKLQFFVNRDFDEFTVYNTMPNGRNRRFDFASQMHAGDVLTINNIPGEKAITLTRDNVPSSLLYGMTPQSDWLDFQRGLNLFRVYAEGAPVPYILTYYNRYGGL